MIYCPACQPQDANAAWIPVLCTACADKLARDRRERASAARRAAADERAVDKMVDAIFPDPEDAP